jgi:hypothetical protein
MSGTVRAGLIFGIAAVFAFVGSLLLIAVSPCIGGILALGSAVALGWGAGYTAAKNTGAGPGQGTARGLTAGAIGGTILLIGSVIVFLLLFLIVANVLNDPNVRNQVEEMLRENPSFRDIDIPTTAVLGLTNILLSGAFLGFCIGIINLVLMLLGGAIGGAMWKGTPGTAATGYGPTGGTPYHPSSSPVESSTRSSEGGVRIYDTDEPNRSRE